MQVVDILSIQLAAMTKVNQAKTLGSLYGTATVVPMRDSVAFVQQSHANQKMPMHFRPAIRNARWGDRLPPRFGPGLR